MSDPETAGGRGIFGLLMVQALLSNGLQYAGYGLEVCLFGFLVRRGRWKRLLGPFLYIGLLLVVDALARPWVLYRHGSNSHEYFYVYWLTDISLALGAFLLVCSFFRKACAQREELWRFLRTFLTFVFLLVAGVSYFSISQHYQNLRFTAFIAFIYHFSEISYFVIAVLNTLLYIMMQQIGYPDEELQLLVCGLGIECAGPAASLALVHLTRDLNETTRSLFTYLAPLCFVGMLLIWFYVVARSPRVTSDRRSDVQRKLPILAEAAGGVR